MLTEERIHEVLDALPRLRADARAAGDELMPFPYDDALAARMPGGAAEVELIHDLQRIAEIHGFLSGTGSLDELRRRIADPAWAAEIAARAPGQADFVAARRRDLEAKLATVDPAEEAAVHSLFDEITAAFAAR